MGEAIRLKSRFDGFELSAYRAAPTDARRGGLVLIQEIFGVTAHIRELADGFADDGYETIAPAFYDRLEPNFEAEYDSPDVRRGVAHSTATPWDQVAGDLQAAIDALAAPVFAVGYCWGGTAAWLAACACQGLSAASSYYGRRIPEIGALTPRCPVILHFGKLDASIPSQQVEDFRTTHPEIPVFVYDAGHGFASDRRRDYHADSARLARLRSLGLFARHGAGRGEI